MTQKALRERLINEAIDKIDELVGEKKSLQQQCADLSEALTKERLANIDMLEALEKGDDIIEQTVKLLCEKSQRPHDDFDIAAMKLGEIGDRNAAAIQKAKP